MLPFRLKPERLSDFEEFFFSSYRKLMEWALQLTGRDREDAEDLVHDLYVQFAPSASRSRGATANRMELDSRRLNWLILSVAAGALTRQMQSWACRSWPTVLPMTRSGATTRRGRMAVHAALSNYRSPDSGASKAEKKRNLRANSAANCARCTSIVR